RAELASKTTTALIRVVDELIIEDESQTDFHAPLSVRKMPSKWLFPGVCLRYNKESRSRCFKCKDRWKNESEEDGDGWYFQLRAIMQKMTNRAEG
ncbi:unnamed protein product, partial [Dovyalis caffra]